MNDECDLCGTPCNEKDGFCAPCRELSRASLARALQSEKNPNRPKP